MYVCVRVSTLNVEYVSVCECMWVSVNRGSNSRSYMRTVRSANQQYVYVCVNIHRGTMTLYECIGVNSQSNTCQKHSSDHVTCNPTTYISRMINWIHVNLARVHPTRLSVKLYLPSTWPPVGFFVSSRRFETLSCPSLTLLETFSELRAKSGQTFKMLTPKL